jgi:hypothetical protein
MVNSQRAAERLSHHMADPFVPKSQICVPRTLFQGLKGDLFGANDPVKHSASPQKGNARGIGSGRNSKL